VQFFENYLLDLVGNARVPQASQDATYLWRKRVWIGGVDTQWVEFDKDLDQIVVKPAIARLEDAACFSANSSTPRTRGATTG